MPRHPTAARRAPDWLLPVGAVVLVGAGVLLLVSWAQEIRGRDGVVLLTGAEPFVGHWDLRVGMGTVVAAGVVAVVAAFGPRLATTLRWGALLAAAGGTALAFTVALGAATSWAGLTDPVRSRHEYLPVVPDAAADPAGFVAAFTAQVGDYPIHVRGHPPGFVVLLAGMDRVGLGGAGWAAALMIVAGTSAVVAVAVTLRRLGGDAGETTARRALPAVVLAPAALWVATTADAFFAGVLAWGVAALAVASTTSRAWVRWVAAVGAGVLLGACPFLSYGLLHMGVLALVVPWATRRWTPTLVAGAVVVLTVLAWGAAGFWLWDGLAATHGEWGDGSGTGRPYLYFLVADVVLLGVLVGPAGTGGLTRVARLDRTSRALVLVAVASALLGALSGFERGEVERIWLPLACWVAPAAAALVDAPRRVAGWRWWIAAQGLATLVIGVVVRSPW
ncbi:hypothetical protein [Cellulosimicrobium arenosum]|uniref:Integral membrane protein n=1 Tax=Cellulosimicrobium arenosum TaxID=2708133 RepID=A0A927IZD5_9MICO|nr:hypothetical protein [Cellulosimicrobium arenosum]MBD8078443.1 hypothetical protein [Cellulosimicrobium arenosum]